MPHADSERHDTLAEFSRLWNAERYFEAHETLEERWRRTLDAGERALIQCAAALLHLQRGNLSGAAKLLRVLAEPLRELAERERSLRALVAWVAEANASKPLDAALLLCTRPRLDLRERAAGPGRRSGGTEG